jgi:hypothetical protein
LNNDWFSFNTISILVDNSSMKANEDNQAEGLFMERAPNHTCTATCPHRMDLDKAAIGLAEASALLSASLSSASKWTIETQIASVRIAWMRLNEATRAYRDHLAEA